MVFDPLRVAILDMYDGEANQGMRCIREIITQFGLIHDIPVIFNVYDVRAKNEMADLSYDVYISTGGPGSPIDSEGSVWEDKFFTLLADIEKYNRSDNRHKKHVFLICHSFQLYCRHHKLGHVTKRRSTSYGVLPMHKVSLGLNDPLLSTLPEPFYAVDSRDWQVVNPDVHKIEAEGGELLCIEKERPHIPLARATMMIRFNDYMVGTQFHPEADPQGMRMYLHREDKKQYVIERYGLEKYEQMLEYLVQDDKIILTHNTILPAFLRMASGKFHNNRVAV
jgi:GMP synthase-like glutamine amidotransferase